MIGTTYSHTHIQSLHRSHEDAFRDLLEFKFDVVRLGCYWNEIQPDSKTFNFKPMISMLEECEKRNQQVVMTVGMKAPRWPEFYVPSWVRGETPADWLEHCLLYLERTIRTLKKFSCITHWQVENEPLDPSGPKQLSIPLPLLKKEIYCVRSLDNKKIISTLWGNELTKRGEYEHMLPYVDAVGIDLYYKVPFGPWFYTGPRDSDTALKKLIATSPKPLWIMELQAEPWEHKEVVTKKREPRSINHNLLAENFERAKALHPKAILLWGYEYWYMKKMQGDERMWNAAKQLTFI